MKIVHAIETLDPAGGGPQSVAVRLAAAQAGLGHEVHIVSHTAPQAMERLAASLIGVPSRNDVRLNHPAPQPGRGRLWGASSRQRIAMLIRDAHFVHLHGVWDPMVWSGAAAARDQSIPYCLCAHGMLDPWSLGQKRLKKALALWLGYRRMLNSAAFIHALNEDEARLLAPLRLTPPIDIVPNGIFIEETEPLPAKGSFATICPAIAGKPFILFMSRLHFKKGLDYLAAAFKALACRRDDVHLVVAGPDDGAKEAFDAAIRRDGLRDRVHLVGALYGAPKFAALADAACFCLPSRQEGFSIAILEAMACGVPVVVSRECHFPEIAAAGAGEIVSLSGSDLAEALLRLLADPERRDRMATAARDLVRRKYVWSNIAARTISLYDSYRGADSKHPPALIPAPLDTAPIGIGLLRSQ